MKCIYAIINLVNGKKYIGSTTNLYRRKQKHLYLLKNNKHHSLSLQNSYNKHGYNNFQFIILKELSKLDVCHIKEQEFLDKFKSYNKKYGYNIAKNAIAPYGINHKKVYKYSFEGLLIGIFTNCLEASKTVNCDHSGIASCCRGKYRYCKGFLWLYEDNLLSLKDRLFLANNKPKVSDLTRKKMSEANLKRIGIKKPIIQYDLNMNFIKEWECNKYASIELKMSTGQICDVLKGNRPHARGFIFKYKE